MVLMCKANGKSSITENIFENRFMHVAELQRLGAKIDVKNNKAIIDGNKKLIGAELMSSDLRASVALVLAAMVSNGKSVINRIYHLDRGYEKIENKLKDWCQDKKNKIVTKYLAKIIANDQEGLQMISACSSGAKVQVGNIKYLASNKVFLLSINRIEVESGKEYKKINSICRFDYVDKVRSKNINQENKEFILELIGIDYLKNNKNYEINLIFNNNAYISLTTETIEVRLEDQNEIK